jgi:hypothetical protein
MLKLDTQGGNSPRKFLGNAVTIQKAIDARVLRRLRQEKNG